jgi:SAM-dependent methyltransferase
MTATEILQQQLDQVWDDPSSWAAEGLHWLHLPEIRAQFNVQVSGDPAVTPIDWFLRQVRPVASSGQHGWLGRVLVLACGEGRIERALAQGGHFSQALAVDLSPQVLARAREQARPWPDIAYQLADMTCLPVGVAPFLEGSFDAVFGVSAVHHCADIPALYDAVSRLLRPGGWFFLDGYVGPDRFQYDDALLGRMNQWLAVLPASVMTTGRGQVKRSAARPVLEEEVRIDPTEAVRASQILPLLPNWFEVCTVRPYGGALLHTVLAHVAQNFMKDAAKPWLHDLIAAESEWHTRSGQPAHFACAIARNRRD